MFVTLLFRRSSHLSSFYNLYRLIIENIYGIKKELNSQDLGVFPFSWLTVLLPAGCHPAHPSINTVSPLVTELCSFGTVVYPTLLHLTLTVNIFPCRSGFCENGIFSGCTEFLCGDVVICLSGAWRTFLGPAVLNPSMLSVSVHSPCLHFG